MFRFILNVISETATILADTSIYLLFGFFIAGLIHVYLRQDKVSKFFGKRDLRSVVNASIFGIPLPLCSCSVLPAAVALRKGGASRGSVFSFLVSTPETSVPSIGISFALLDPLMTFFRPVAAFVTAILAGIGVNFLDRNAEGEGGNEGREGQDVEGKSGSEPDEVPGGGQPLQDETTVQKVERALKFAFVELLDDLAPWLVIGLISAGVIAALVPENFFAGFLSRGIWPMLLMLIVGIPLYVCAEGSTPIAAALILKGLSPGAAFVFLLAGPATNISSLIVLSKYFSRKVLALYLATIAFMALIFGGLLNAFYSFFNLDVSATLGSAAGIIPGWIKVGATFVLIVMLHRSLVKTNQYSIAWQWSKDKLSWSGGRLVRVLAVVLVVIYLADGLFTVPAGNTGMVVTFGEVVRSDLQPGLYYRPPTPFGRTVLVPTDLVQCLEIGFRRTSAEGGVVLTPAGGATSIVGEKLDRLPSRDMPVESELLAGDENLIDIDLTVHYSIEDAYQTTFKVEDVEQLLRQLTTYQILNQIAIRKVSDELTAERADFAMGVQNGLQRSLTELGVGIKIHRVNLVYAHAPSVVHPAFRDVASAMEDKFRLINLAQTDSISALASARAGATKKLSTARADSAQKVRQATGESRRFLDIASKTRSQRADQQFRLNAEAAESTLVNLEKILVLSEGSGALDLIFVPQTYDPTKNIPPEVLERLQRSIGQP